EAKDVVALAAAELDAARSWVREYEGWGFFKTLYTKFTPDIGSLVPDLRRQAPLVSPALILGTGIAAACLILVWLLAKFLPALRRGAVVALGVGGLALLASPGVWALSPLWSGTNRMLPSADPSVFTRRQRELEQQARESVRWLGLVLNPSG